MKKYMANILKNGFVLGMASIFCPSVIEVETVDFKSKSDAQNLADDWKQIGSYISKVYESFNQ